MKISRDSIKFLTKIVTLVAVLLAGYAKNNQRSSPAQKEAVDLIITNGTDQKTPEKKIKITGNQSV